VEVTRQSHEKKVTGRFRLQPPQKLVERLGLSLKVLLSPRTSYLVLLLVEQKMGNI
jgi:hypothetical protein